MGRRLTWRPRVSLALLHGSSLGASTCDAAPWVERWKGTGNRRTSARTRHPPATNPPSGDDVDRPVLPRGREGDKLIARMARHGGADYLTRVGIERRIQGQCAVPVVLEPMPFRAAGGERQDRINPVETLNRRFLIDAEELRLPRLITSR